MDIVLQIKLAAIIVHLEEWQSPGGHEYDKAVLDSLLSSPDVREFLRGMQKECFLPARRDGVSYD